MIWKETVIEGRYRYVLPRYINDSQKQLAVIQINPSLANGKRSDPTVGKVEKWVKEKGYGSVYFLNFFAVVNPRQEDISGDRYEALVGPKNDSFIRGVCGIADIVIATGEPQGILAIIYDQREEQLKHLLTGQAIYRVGRLTRKGYPRHGRSWNLQDREKESYGWRKK